MGNEFRIPNCLVVVEAISNRYILCVVQSSQFKTRNNNIESHTNTIRFLSASHTGKGDGMDTLGKMKEKVTVLLETYPKLRDDDFLLIGAVYSQFYGVGYSDSFLDVMKHHEEKKLPSFESIRRTRQKVQEERLDLCSSKAKQKEKQISFSNYYDFAKGH